MVMSYIEQLEEDKFQNTFDDKAAILIKIETGNVTGVPSQHSVVDRENSKFTTVNNKTAVKVVVSA